MPICFSDLEQKVTIVLPQRDFRWNEAFEVTKSEKLRETNSPLGLDAFQLDSKMCLRNVQMNIKILEVPFQLLGWSLIWALLVDNSSCSLKGSSS